MNTISPPPRRRFRRLLAALGVAALAACPSIARAEPKGELLWPGGAPGAKGDSDDDKPTLTIFLPPKEQANGAAVVVCPGGGYGHLAISYEGFDIGRWLNDHGIAAFVLKYRHRGSGYAHPAPLDDAQRAIRTVRARAKEFGVDPARIGILGFSAGGHLASSAGTHFDAGKADADDRIERAGCRPDFLILCYPVISFTTPYAHAGSRKNLLGENADAGLVEKFSNELQVTPETPPAFLWHTDADSGVPPENSVLFYLALRKAKVPAELHIYEQGRHGLGLAEKQPGAAGWPTSAIAWMRGQGLLDSK
jgi:acetyl esterase/lipase